MQPSKRECSFSYRAALALWLILLQPLMILAGEGVPVSEGYDVYSLGRYYTVNDQKKFDPRTYIEEDHMGFRAGDCTTNTSNAAPKSPKINLGTFRNMFWGAPDKFNLYSMGTDPANLRPEGVDLNIFPEFPVSEELVLKPSLAYGEEALYSRRGDVIYGAPKKWSNHYGELVRLIPDTSNVDKPLGELANGSVSQERLPVPQEIQTYFTNAQGQSVSFYPARESFPDYSAADPDTPSMVNVAGRNVPYINTWHSETGNYLLKDISADSEAEQTFTIKAPGGLTFEMEYYKTMNGHDGLVQSESLSAHYRVARIVDNYGNYIKIEYVNPSSLQPTHASSYNYTIPEDTAGGGNYLHRISYGYDVTGRLTTITVPAVNGGTNTYTMRYADDPQGDLAEAAFVHWKDGSTVVANANTAGIANFVPFQVAGNSGDDAVQMKGPSIMYLDLQNVEQNLRMGIRFDEPGYEGQLFTTDTYYFKAFDQIFRLGQLNRVSPQQTPRIHDESMLQQGHRVDIINHRVNWGPDGSGTWVLDNEYPDSIWVSSVDTGYINLHVVDTGSPVEVSIREVDGDWENPILMQSGAPGYFYERLIYKDAQDPVDVRVRVGGGSWGSTHEVTSGSWQIGGGGVLSSGGPCNGCTFPKDRVSSLDVFPMLKKGDKLFNGNDFFTLDDTRLDMRGTPGFSPEEVNVNNLPVGSNYKLLRRDNLNRIAEIGFPVNNMKSKRMRLFYDDQTINHQEIRVVELAESRNAEYHLRTEYTYEHLWVLPGEEDFTAAVVTANQPAGAQGKCTLNSNRTLGGDDRPCQEMLVIGIGLARLQEMDVLRQKTVSFKDYDSSGNLVDQTPLITRFGGAFNFVMAGSAPEVLFDNDGSGTGPSTPCGSGECYLAQWSLSGKPFHYTWRIEPDGQTTLFDTDPAGVDLDPTLAVANKGSRVFKTYKFDEGFLKGMGEVQAPLFDFSNHPYYRFTPQYFGDVSAPVMRDNPVHFTGYELPALSSLFELDDSKCFSATVNSFEPVPLYGYNQSTDASNADNFFHRETMKVLYGRTEWDGGGNCSNRYYRTSAAQYIATRFSGSVADSKARELFKGRFIAQFFPLFLDWENAGCLPIDNATSVPADGCAGDCPEGSECRVPFTLSDTPQEIEMTWGGRIDLGNRMASFGDRQKIHRLQPGISYTVVDYDGISWNTSTNTIALDINKIQELKRQSNGGYLAARTFSQDEGAADGSTTFTRTNQPMLRKGDIFYYHNRVHTVLSRDATTITFEPALRADAYAPNGEYVVFYRYYNPDFSGTAPVVDNYYQGYDWFLNQGFTDTHSRPESLTLHTSANDTIRYLIPKININEATSRSFSDATEWVNQDLVNWHFGKITASISTHRLPLYNDGNSAGALGIDRGIRTTYSYDDPNFPWKTTQKVVEYAPQSISYAQRVASLAQNFTVNPQDLITDYSWYSEDSTSGVRRKGRKRLEKTYFADKLGAFSLVVTDYDTKGFLHTTDEGTFKDGDSPYGTRTQSWADAHTGLPLREARKVCDIAPDGTVSNEWTQSTVFNVYDNLSRKTKTWANDSRNQDSIVQADDTYLNGGVTQILYSSPFLQRTFVTDKSGAGSLLLSESYEYKNGMGMKTLSFNRRGSSGKYWGTAIVYDAYGREGKTYFEKNFNFIPSISTIGEMFQGTAYSKTVYNHRGEPAGSFVHDPEDGSTSKFQWRQTTFTDEGERKEHHYVYDEDGNARVNIKAIQFDRFGNPAHINDFTQSPVTPPLTWDVAVSAFDTYVLDTPISGVSYSYDRNANVTHAVAGIETTGPSPTTLGGEIQERFFYYDQLNRLRFEDHPEMDEDILYGNFNLQGSAELITSGSRTTTLTYDAYGLPLTNTYREGTQTVTDTFSYTDRASGFPGLPKTTTTTENGRGLVYRYSYDGVTGLLTSKKMLHNFNEFNGYGYTADIQNPDWGNALELALRYDFHNIYTPNPNDSYLGIVRDTIYPTANEAEPPAGSQPVVNLDYDDFAYGLLPVGATDQSLGLPLAKNLVYERDAKLLTYEYGVLDGQEYGGTFDYDNQNRLNHQEFVLDARAGLFRNRYYGFDPMDRINSIGYTENGPSENGFTYDALGQIKTATVRGGNGLTDYDFAYEYGEEGLGNLSHYSYDDGSGENTISRSTDILTNRITEMHFAYNPFGELSGGERFDGLSRSGDPYTLGYNPKGRLVSYTESGSTAEAYFYDAGGMRVLTSRTDKDDNTEHTLYFYDQNNMVLSEWVNKGTPRWNKHRFYLSGQTSVTYEYDEKAATPAASVPATPPLSSFLAQKQPPPPDLLTSASANKPTFYWGKTQGVATYDLEVGQMVAGEMVVVHQVKGIQGQQYTVNQLPLGDYFVRVCSAGGYFGNWQPFSYVRDDLIAYYRLEGNMEDLIGDRDRDGGLNGNQQWAEGPFGQYMVFDGTYTKGIVRNIHAWPEGRETRTIMCWIYPFANANRQTVFDYGYYTYAVDYERMRLQVEMDKLVLDLGDTILSQNVRPNDSVNLNQWNHCAVTYNGGEFKVFLNGSLVARHTALAVTRPIDFVIGVSQPHQLGQGHFLGGIDEIEVISRDLSASEIQEIALRGLTGLRR